MYHEQREANMYIDREVFRLIWLLTFMPLERAVMQGVVSAEK